MTSDILDMGVADVASAAILHAICPSVVVLKDGGFGDSIARFGWMNLSDDRDTREHVTAPCMLGSFLPNSELGMDFKKTSGVYTLSQQHQYVTLALVCSILFSLLITLLLAIYALASRMQ